MKHSVSVDIPLKNLPPTMMSSAPSGCRRASSANYIISVSKSFVLAA